MSRINWNEEEVEKVARRYLALKSANPGIGEGIRSKGTPEKTIEITGPFDELPPCSDARDREDPSDPST